MVNTTPLQSTKTKRSLPSSPNSPIPTGKKNKSFVSPNQFAVLATEEDNDIQPDITNTHEEIVNITECQQDDRAPPIYIQNINNFSAFIKTLVQLTGPEGFICKSTSSYLIVRPDGRSNYNIILKHLKDTNASFHTFLPPRHRSYKIIIRNLHQSTLIPDIIDALSEIGHSARRVVNVSKNGRRLPIFLVELEPDSSNKEILNTSTLLHTIIKVELPYSTNNGPPQCHNCQRYGHTANYCNHAARCVKCAGDHLSEMCSKDKNSPAKCVLCAGDHTSNYKGCPSYKELLKRRKTTQPNRHTSKNTNTNTAPTPLLPTSSAHHLDDSYAAITNSKNNILPNSSTIDKLVSKLISELTALINPLISLLTSFLQKQVIP